MRRTIIATLFSVLLGIGIHFTATAYADSESCQGPNWQAATLEKVLDLVCENKREASSATP